MSLLLLINNASSQQYSAKVLKYITVCTAEKNKTTQTDSVIIQINNREGDHYTEIIIPYYQSEKVSNIFGWIENVDGKKVRDLKSSEITDRNAISNTSLYEDHFIKSFQLKHSTYPYKIFYTYKTTRSDFLTIAWWSPILFGPIRTDTAILRVVVPKNIQYNKSVNNISDYSIDSTNNSIIHIWRSNYIQPMKPEIYSQPQKSYPYVRMAPLNFTYGVDGSTADWKSFGNWQWRLNKGLDILPENEKKNINEITKGITDKKEIVKILYHYLQDHTRYVNVILGIGGFKPYPASYVSENKYGDCKALTNYMKAMLSYMGIESYYTLVNASDQPLNLIKDFAAPQFNHVILSVPINKDTIWLENTSNINPFGYLGTFTQNREVLFITDQGSKLLRTPGLTKEQTLSKSKLEYDLNVSGFTKIFLKYTFSGKLFERFNAIQNDYNDVSKEKIIQEYMPFNNFELVNWKLNKPNRDTARIELNATLNLSKVLNPIGNEYYFSLPSSNIPSFTIPANRIFPVHLPYPICNEDTLIYKLPTGYELKTRCDSVLISTRYGHYSMKMTTHNSNVYVSKRMEVFAGSYSLKEYPEFYSFIKAMKNIDTKKILIKPLL